VKIIPDVPAPRCLKVSGDQRLKVTNTTGATIHVTLGSFTFDLQPGAEGALEQPFQEYLAPGVHRLLATPFSGPELWLGER
jgi:hypothetical protein